MRIRCRTRTFQKTISDLSKLTYSTNFHFTEFFSFVHSRSVSCHIAITLQVVGYLKTGKNTLPLCVQVVPVVVLENENAITWNQM